MSQLLTRDEVIELTGASTKRGQCQVLEQNNIHHVVRKDGWPSVTWDHVNNPRPEEVRLTIENPFEPNKVRFL